MMTTDKELIGKAVAQIAGEDAYIRLRDEDFAHACPAPAWAVHVRGQSPGDVMARLEQELAQADIGELEGIVAYIRTASMTLAELAGIDGLLPHARRFRRGLAFLPDGSGTDVWIFACTGRDKEDSQK